jgi:Nucleotidyl transferase AbiEii toxin, Type IV TA system
MEWFNLPDKRKKIIINQAAFKLGIPDYAIEKDWWVTLTLRAIFALPIGKHLIFKGGTSLSKGWQLIERFSEDIDLVIDRSFLGFEGELSKSQIDKLRKKSCAYISTQLKDALQQQLETMGLSPKNFTLQAQEITHTDTDPQTLVLHYNPLFNEHNVYLKPQILIEIGARSLKEPAENRLLQSFIGQNFSQLSFADKPFDVLCVNPQRTFLEKIFLLHEEFLKPIDKIKSYRMSRHIFDIHSIMDTEFGLNAVKNIDLFQTIVAHRQRYTPIRGIDYAFHTPKTLQIIPPPSVISTWKQDYKEMTNDMIHGEIPSFEILLTRMEELMKRFSEA